MTTQQSLLERILGSVFFKSAMNKAPKFAKNSESLLKLLRSALVKTKELGVGGVFDVLRENITLLGRMIKAYASGEYRDISPASLLKIIGGLIYFISPIDLIPDFLPFVGFADDIALLVWILKSINDEVEKFKAWDRF